MGNHEAVCKYRKSDKYKIACKTRQLKQYGMTIEDYERMRISQDNKCAMCHTQVDELVVDHNHVSGKVRSLLCRRCNLVVGVYEKNLKRFSEYLIKHGSEGI